MQTPSEPDRPKATIARHTRRRLAAAVLALGAAAALVCGPSTVFAASGTHHPVERIALVERLSYEHFTDLGKHGVSVGDHTVIRSDVLNPHGKLVGRLDADCTITGTGSQLGGLCHGAMTLPGGQLVVEFAWGRAGSTTLQAILGGTGKYEGARGQAIVDIHGSDSHEAFIVELLP